MRGEHSVLIAEVAREVPGFAESGKEGDFCYRGMAFPEVLGGPGDPDHPYEFLRGEACG